MDKYSQKGIFVEQLVVKGKNDASLKEHKMHNFLKGAEIQEKHKTGKLRNRNKFY